jgi:phage-related protein
MNLEKVFNFIKEKKGYSVPTLYKLLNDIPVSDDEKTEYINKMNLYSLSDSKEPDRIINILLSSEEFINKLDSSGIYYLLKYSTEPEKIINILGNKGIEYINKLDSDGISKLLSFSRGKEIIRKYRPDVQLK